MDYKIVDHRQYRMRLSPTTSAFTVLLGVCAGLPALSIDLSAPTLTLLPAALNTTVVTAGLSLSLFVAGFAVGQFFGGRTSDRIGRRPVLLIGLFVYVLSGLCCALATSGPALVTARLIQGLGAGGCAVQASAMVQDLFEGEAARRKQSYVSVVLMVVPLLAPAIGTVLMEHLGWRSVHLTLALGGAVLAMVVMLFVDESHRPHEQAGTVGLGFQASLRILESSVFRRITVVNALSYGAIFSYIAGAPVVVMHDLALSPAIYATLFAATALALSLGALTSARLGRRNIACERFVWPGLVCQACATLALMLSGVPFDHKGLFVAIPALLVCAFSRGLLSPNLMYLAVSRHRDQAGLASALVGLVQLLVGAIAGAVVAAALSPFGFHGVASIMAFLACAAAVVWRLTEGSEPARAAQTAD